jgi:cytochrome c556
MAVTRSFAEETMKRPLYPVLIAASLALAAPAQAQFAKPEDAYRYRASVMFLQSQHLGRINAQLKSDKPNLELIAANAAVLDTINRLFFAAFPEGSDKVANSRAKPDIWKDQSKFKQYADRVNADVSQLLAASKAGDLAAVRASFQSVGQGCKACHDDFRRD